MILVRSINATVRRVVPYEKAVYLTYRPITHKNTAHLRAKVVFLGDVNTSILDFPGDGHVEAPRDGDKMFSYNEADAAVDMSRGFESLYVYTNIVERRFLGDSLVPFLHVTPLNGEQSETVSRSFEKIQ